MNIRERQLAILDHQPPDRIPWVPRLELWYEAHRLQGTLPARFTGMTLRQVETAIGCGTTGRFGHFYTTSYDAVVEHSIRQEGGKRITEWRTPLGSVRQVEHYSEDLQRQGLPGRVEEYPLKVAADYKVWEYVVEHTRWHPAYDAFRAYDAAIGDDGLPMASAGDVPFHHLILDLIGYENAFYHLADYLPECEHLMNVMWEVERIRFWPVIAAAPARLFLHGVHLSSQFTPPRLFLKYILPYYREFMPLMHAVGKSITMHADNDVSLIVNELAEAGWDMMECFVTAPMVPLTLERAREVWGNRIILFGGLPSVMLSPHISEDEFRRYVAYILRTIAPGDAFILGVADNVMPDSIIERIEWVTEFIVKNGNYPITL